MANDCTDIDVVLRQINQRLRKLEKSDFSTIQVCLTRTMPVSGELGKSR